MVPEAGLEPAQGCPRGILSPLRLPIPPLRHTGDILALPRRSWQVQKKRGAPGFCSSGSPPPSPSVFILFIVESGSF